jgi:hypothetical protein
MNLINIYSHPIKCPVARYQLGNLPTFPNFVNDNPRAISNVNNGKIPKEIRILEYVTSKKKIRGQNLVLLYYPVLFDLFSPIWFF